MASAARYGRWRRLGSPPRDACDAQEARLPPSTRRSAIDAGTSPSPITADERRGRIEKARRLMVRAQDRRADAHRRHVAGLLHRHPVGPERTAVCDGAPVKGEPFFVSPGVRGGSRARADRARTARRQRRCADAGKSTRARTSAWHRDSATAASPPGRLGIEETVRLRLQRRRRAGAAPALKIVAARRSRPAAG